MRVYFQNPTQGPLITVSFEDAGDTSLAFVPAAMSCEKVAGVLVSGTGGAAGTVGGASATGGLSLAGPLALAFVLSGDSSPRAQPLRGLSRFASAVVADGEQSISDSSPVGPAAVNLPNDATEPTTATSDAAQPVDWAALLTADPRMFFERAHGQVAKWKQEILRRLDAGESPSSILAWLNAAVFPEMADIFKVNQQLPSSLSAVRHDFGHSVHDLKFVLPDLLETGDAESIGDVRLVCDTSSNLLDRIMAQLMTIFAGRVVVVRGEGMPELELKVAAAVDVDRLIAVLENLIRNAGDHPKSGEVPTVFIERKGNQLIVRDTAAGMDEATVQKIRDAVRIHDGKEVTSGDHGFGWQSIRENCDKLGIKWEIQSKEGEGTTVTLTLPDGFFVPL